jgi:hypothetical protein
MRVRYCKGLASFQAPDHLAKPVRVFLKHQPGKPAGQGSESRRCQAKRKAIRCTDDDSPVMRWSLEVGDRGHAGKVPFTDAGRSHRIRATGWDGAPKVDSRASPFTRMWKPDTTTTCETAEDEGQPFGGGGGKGRGRLAAQLGWRLANSL